MQSFFDPTWMDLGTLAVYGRVAGVNWVWAEHLTIYHALVSIAASIAFVEALYPSRRGERWIASRKWWLANWAGLIGIYLVWELLTAYDAGVWKWLAWLAIFGLIALARIVPARFMEARPRPVPRPRRFFVTGFLGMLGQFFLIYTGADENAYPWLLAMLFLVLFDLFILWLVLRWSGNGAAWDDRQRMALVIGVLSFFLVLGPLTTNGQYPVMYFSNPVFLFLLWLAYRKVDRRVKAELTSA
ncbi:MAG: hypothetical protein ABIJ39_14750 [Chloroflexota bacterium]